jgi:hypothetical protein
MTRPESRLGLITRRSQVSICAPWAMTRSASRRGFRHTHVRVFADHRRPLDPFVALTVGEDVHDMAKSLHPHDPDAKPSPFGPVGVGNCPTSSCARPGVRVVRRGQWDDLGDAGASTTPLRPRTKPPTLLKPPESLPRHSSTHPLLRQITRSGCTRDATPQPQPPKPRSPHCGPAALHDGGRGHGLDSLAPSPQRGGPSPPVTGGSPSGGARDQPAGFSPGRMWRHSRLISSASHLLHRAMSV